MLESRGVIKKTDAGKAQDTRLTTLQAWVTGERVSLSQASSLPHHPACGQVEMASVGFLGGPVVQNPPANAGGMVPSLGRSQMQWSN